MSEPVNIIGDLVKLPEVVSVTNLDEFNEVTSVLTSYKDKLKEVDADEKSLTAPINKSLKDIRSRYKPVKERLEVAITTMRNALNTYKQAEDRKREADRLALEELSKDGASMTDLVSLVDEAPMLGGRLTTMVDVDRDLMTADYKQDILYRVWDAAMVVIRKDVAAGRVEAGVIVTKEKKI